MARQKLIPYIHEDGAERKLWDHYFVDSSSGVIYFMKSHAGRKIKFSTKTKVPHGTKAKAFANKEFDRRTKTNARIIRTSIKEELALWLDLKSTEDLAYDTMNNIRRAASQIEEFWGDMLPNEITRDHFVAWQKFWKETHPKIEMENAVKYLNVFMGYLHEKVVNDRPLLPSRLRFAKPNMKAIKARRAKKKERVFTADEFRTILKAAASDEERLVATFMYTMATRIDETLKLKFEESIFMDQGRAFYRWTIGQNKADLVGSHFIHPNLVEPLERLKEIRDERGTALLFPQVHKAQALKTQQIDWKAWRERANLGWHWTAHTFRHTCLTNLFNDARNPQAVICKLYRVSLTVAMETYVKVTPEAMLAMYDSITIAPELVALNAGPE